MSRTRKIVLSIIAVVTGASLVGLVAFEHNRDVAAERADDRPQTIYVAAQKEAVVNIWASNAEELTWIPSAFEKVYPGIKVEVYTDLNVASRAITEARSGLHNVDVVWSSEALVQPLIERDLLIDNEWHDLGVRPEDVGAGGHMAITNSSAFGVAYRTDRVKSEDLPRKWSELLDPKYRGLMAASPILSARLAAALGAFEGRDIWAQFAQRLHSESEMLWSNDLLEQAIVSGERPYVVATSYYLAERWKHRGLPIEVYFPEPVFVTQFGSVVMRQAPHPNAARLLAAWLASNDGRSMREKVLLAIDLRPSSDHPKAIELRESGKRLYVDSVRAIEARNKLIPEMDRIFSGLN